MLNRRTLLKTSAAVIPMTAALVGVGVVEQMHGISGGRLPTEHLDEAFTFNLDDARSSRVIQRMVLCLPWRHQAQLLAHRHGDLLWLLLGAQTVRMKLPQSVRVKSVELLQAGQSVAFGLEGEVMQFTIPRVEDYEVAAITVS